MKQVQVRLVVDPIECEDCSLPAIYAIFEEGCPYCGGGDCGNTAGYINLCAEHTVEYCDELGLEPIYVD